MAKISFLQNAEIFSHYMAQKPRRQPAIEEAYSLQKRGYGLIITISDTFAMYF
jgi:hypothetical protein